MFLLLPIVGNVYINPDHPDIDPYIPYIQNLHLNKKALKQIKSGNYNDSL